MKYLMIALMAVVQSVSGNELSLQDLIQSDNPSLRKRAAKKLHQLDFSEPLARQAVAAAAGSSDERLRESAYIAIAAPLMNPLYGLDDRTINELVRSAGFLDDDLWHENFRVALASAQLLVVARGAETLEAILERATVEPKKHHAGQFVRLLEREHSIDERILDRLFTLATNSIDALAVEAAILLSEYEVSDRSLEALLSATSDEPFLGYPEALEQLPRFSTDTLLKRKGEIARIFRALAFEMERPREERPIRMWDSDDRYQAIIESLSLTLGIEIEGW